MTTLSDIKPNPRNPRKISDSALAMLKQSMDEFGDISGIVHNIRDNTWVGGHQRNKNIPQDAEIIIRQKYDPPTRTGTVAEGHVIIAGEKWNYRAVDWDEDKAKAAMISANKQGGEWDFPVLSEVLLELDHSNYEMDLTGYGSDEVEKMMTQVSAHERELPDGAKELTEDEFSKFEHKCPRCNFEFNDKNEINIVCPKCTHSWPRVKLGDIYELGKHRLMCGDSTSIDAVEKLMNGEKADMVFTDPPYGMNLDTNYEDNIGKSKIGKTTRNYKPVIGDDQEFQFLDVYALVESVPEQFWWGADYYCDKLVKGGSWFVWNKRTTEALQEFHGSHFELCWSKQKHQREIAHIAWSGAFGHHRKDDGDFKVHPTMKAVKLIEWFFERFKGEKVVDLFGGSGSTLIACEKTNRRCFMMEIDPYYCQVIINRWEKYSGGKAVLVTE